MLVKAWRFAAVMLAALTMALAFCHLMEMPPRLGWDASLWVGSTVRGGVFLPRLPGWIRSTGPKAAETLAKTRIPPFTRRVRRDSAT